MSETRENGGPAPSTILILPDGNRRWAINNGIPYPDAYEQGARRIVECCHHLGSLGIRETWFGIARPFNFKRTKGEVRAVLDACLKIQAIGREDGKPFNITIGGDFSLMPPVYQQAFKAQESDHNPDGTTANLLIGWSSDTEAARFACRIQDYPSESVRDQMLRSSAIAKPLDFLIRTGIDTPEGNGAGYRA